MFHEHTSLRDACQGNFQEAKNTLFERFCEWYETAAHELSAITLFDVRKWMEEFQGDSNEEVYTLKTINRKLKAKQETAYDSRLVSVNHLLCCSMKRQIKSYLKVHWRRF